MNTSDYLRCKVACGWLNGGITLRFSETKWLSQSEAVDHAAGCHASGKYFKIEILTQRRRNGRWTFESRTKYPPPLPQQPSGQHSGKEGV